MNATRISTYWENTKALPLFLRGLIQGAMFVTPIFLFLLALPITDWEVNGRSISYAELWSSGDGIVVAISLLFMGSGAWGLAARYARCRWLLVLSPMPYLILAVFPSPISGPITFGGVVNATVAAVIVYFALFRLQSIQKYLAFEGDGL